MIDTVVEGFVEIALAYEPSDASIFASRFVLQVIHAGE